jgi:hypothetical protein
VCVRVFTSPLFITILILLISPSSSSSHLTFRILILHIIILTLIASSSLPHYVPILILILSPPLPILIVFILTSSPIPHLHHLTRLLVVISFHPPSCTCSPHRPHSHPHYGSKRCPALPRTDCSPTRALNFVTAILTLLHLPLRQSSLNLVCLDECCSLYRYSSPFTIRDETSNK